MKSNKKITILTCSDSHLLDEVKCKYNIIDLGNVGEQTIINAMNACDFFLMPSKAESFGMMALEAMACEKPVIIFDNSALPSVTFAPNCGLLVKNKNSNDLKAKIEFLINNKKECIKRGKLGRQLCEKYYTYDKYVENLSNLYKDLKAKNNNLLYNKKGYDKKEFDVLKDSIDAYLKRKKIISFDCNILKNETLVNDINDYIYDKYIVNNESMNISIKSRIMAYLKNNKLVKRIYYGKLSTKLRKIAGGNNEKQS